jgi:hypothetical protein
VGPAALSAVDFYFGLLRCFDIAMNVTVSSCVSSATSSFPYSPEQYLPQTPLTDITEEDRIPPYPKQNSDYSAVCLLVVWWIF